MHFSVSTADFNTSVPHQVGLSFMQYCVVKKLKEGKITESIDFHQEIF